MCDTVATAAFIPMTCHRWLMVLFPMTKSNWPVTKSWLLGWPKLCWFQLYCSKTIWSIWLIFSRYVTRYIHIILTILQEATQCLTLWKNKFGKFLQELFSRGVYTWLCNVDASVCTPRAPFFLGLISIPAWISNYIHYKVWVEITYPFPNFNGWTVEVWEWISNFSPHFTRHVITFTWL